MDGERRRRLAREVLHGYFSGPDAQLEATTTALATIESARCVVLVEGISDQIALDAIAAQRGRDLGAEGIVIVPVGGAHAITRYLVRFGPQGEGLAVTGMCDAGEADIVRLALALSGFGHPKNRAEMESLGFFVCVKDLEDELIRASGRPTIETLLASQKISPRSRRCNSSRRGASRASSLRCTAGCVQVFAAIFATPVSSSTP